MTVSSFSGGTPNSNKEKYWNGNILWASPKDFTGEITLSDTQDRISEVGKSEAGLKIAEPGAILLVVRSGILKHTLPVAVCAYPMTVNQDIRVLNLAPELNTLFLAEFLSAGQDRILPRITKHSTTVQSINTAELDMLPIPIPPLEIQTALVDQLQTAREQRRRNLAEADSLLSTMDGWLLEKLGIQIATPPNRFAYATKAGDINRQQRMNADYFHPERTLTIRAIAEQFVHLSPTPLHEVAYFLRDRSDASVDPYLGLARVQSNTGELTNVTEEIEGECLLFAENDVLFAKLRPYLNKVYRAEFAGSCSPEFHVIRVRGDSDVIPDYLATILRSQLIVSQTKHMMTGNTHPRITSEDVVNLVIPIPDLPMQGVIVEEIKRRRNEARRLRAEAEAEWNAAKAHFEAQLLSRVEA